MKIVSMIIAAVFAFCGCSTVRQTAITSGTGTNLVRTTTLTVHTLGDAKQIIESLKASNGATHTLGATGVQQETTSKALEDLVALAAMAAKAYAGQPGPVVPPSAAPPK